MLISYKYKFYHSKKNKALEYMMSEAAFVWNHALALQKRYYSIAKQFGWETKYIPYVRMAHHFAKRIKRTRLSSATVQELLIRQDKSFLLFFKHKAQRPPKFRKSDDFSSFVFKQSGYKLYGNELLITKTSKRFKFSLSRPYDGQVKIVRILRSRGDWFIIIVADTTTNKYGKTHTGASIGIDFGLKMFMTFSDGTEVQSPRFYKHLSGKIAKWQRLLSKSVKGSNHYRAYRKQLNRVYSELADKRHNWFYQTAHEICRKYDFIFIEDLNISGMAKLWGKKVNDLCWVSFIQILGHIATKYGVTVHKIPRNYPSSRLCECGYKNRKLRLCDRTWVCPECGKFNHRDLNAARNIYRQGIVDLRSVSKTNQGYALVGMAR